MTHTPGPWKVVRNRHSHTMTTVGNGDYGAVAETYRCRPSPDENHANAHLIAAAPAMLEALKAARDFIAFEGIGSMKEGLVADMDSIISQAEGK